MSECNYAVAVNLYVHKLVHFILMAAIDKDILNDNGM